MDDFENVRGETVTDFGNPWIICGGIISEANDVDEKGSLDDFSEGGEALESLGEGREGILSSSKLSGSIKVNRKTRDFSDQLDLLKHVLWCRARQSRNMDEGSR